MYVYIARITVLPEVGGQKIEKTYALQLVGLGKIFFFFNVFAAV